MPLGLVLALELAFRLGVWEPLAEPMSHAGVAIMLKRAWQAYPAPIDVVTIGNSRAMYGFDAARFAEAAAAHGLTHASFAMAGSHWMTVRAVSRWVERHRPEVKKRLIALSVMDFQALGNGPYELAIVEPLRRWQDAGWIAEHVPFNRADAGTYGVYSALFAYREDVRVLLASPRERWDIIRWARQAQPFKPFDGPRVADTICDIDTTTLAACANAPPASAAALRTQQQCRGLLAKPRRNGETLTGVDDENRRRLREALTAELGNPRWRGNTVVVLMPTHHLWLAEVAPQRLREWTLDLLRPLVAEGSIALLDYTDFLDVNGRTDCAALWDIYHQNEASAARLTRALIDDFGRVLY